MKKIMYSMLLAVIMMLTCLIVPDFFGGRLVTNAITTSEVESKVQALMDQYVGTTWDDEYYGIQCKGFANLMYFKIFGVDHIGPYDSQKYYIPNPKESIEVGRLDFNQMSIASAKELLLKGSCGDFIQVRRRNKDWGHSMILVGTDSNGISVFDCNSDNKNGVRHYYVSYDEFYSKNSAMSLYHYVDYNQTSVPPEEVKITNKYISEIHNDTFRVVCDVKGATSVRIATWTANDQSDLAWRDAYSNGAGSFYYDIPYSEHNANAKSYISHIYAYNGAGDTDVDEIVYTPESVKITNKYISSKNNDTFRVVCDVKGATSVRMATWTASDQSDLVWRDAYSNGAGSFYYDIPYNEHNANATSYISDIYAYNGAGDTDVDEIIHTRELPKPNPAPKFKDKYISQITDNSFRVVASLENGVDNVQIATWTKDHSDLVWRSAYSNGAGDWFYDIPFSEHNSDPDRYISDIYAYDAQGQASVDEIIFYRKATVKFDANNGSVSTTNKKVTYNKKYGSLPTPTRKGYKFEGWYTAKTNGTKITENSTFKTLTNGELTLYAHWTPIEYTITLNSNGGNNANPNNIKVKMDATYGKLPTPKREGYVLDGWFTDKTGGTKIIESTKFTKGENQTLYAHWVAKTVVVKFYRNQTNEDTSSVYETFTFGVSNQKFSYKSWMKEGYEMLGWSADRNAKTATYSTYLSVSDSWINNNSPTINLYAVWQEKEIINTSAKDIASSEIRVFYPDKTKVSTNGEFAICNDITIIDVKEGKTLEMGVDYKLNGNTSTSTGLFTIDIVGINDYCGVKEIPWEVVLSSEKIASSKILNYRAYNINNQIEFTVTNNFNDSSKNIQYGVLLYRGKESINNMTLEAADNKNIFNSTLKYKTAVFRVQDIGYGVYVRPYIKVNGTITYGKQVYVIYSELNNAIEAVHSEIMNCNREDNNGTLRFVANFNLNNNKDAKYGVLLTNKEVNELTIDNAMVDHKCKYTISSFITTANGANGITLRTYVLINGEYYYGPQKTFRYADYS